MKVAYNTCYGGFGLSDEAMVLYEDLRRRLTLSSGECVHNFGSRHDPLLLEVIDRLGEKANGKYCRIKITEIPDEYASCYQIKEYDGMERVVCDPARLVHSRLKGLDVKAMTDSECRTLLAEMVGILAPNTNLELN